MEDLKKSFVAIAEAKEKLQEELTSVISDVVIKFQSEYGVSPSDIYVTMLHRDIFGERIRKYIVENVEVKFDHE